MYRGSDLERLCVGVLHYKFIYKTRERRWFFRLESSYGYCDLTAITLIVRKFT